MKLYNRNIKRSHSFLLKCPWFYSAKYFGQYINGSTTNKLLNSYNNFLTIHIGYKSENGEAHFET